MGVESPIRSTSPTPTTSDEKIFFVDQKPIGDYKKEIDCTDFVEFRYRDVEEERKSSELQWDREACLTLVTIFS